MAWFEKLQTSILKVETLLHTVNEVDRLTAQQRTRHPRLVIKFLLNNVRGTISFKAEKPVRMY